MFFSKETHWIRYLFIYSSGVTKVNEFIHFVPGFPVFRATLSQLKFIKSKIDRLSGLVVTVSGYRYRGPGFHSWRFHIFWEAADLERGPLSFVRTTEELLGRNSSGSSLENPRLMTREIRCADHATPSIRKSWHYLANKRRSLGRHSSLADQSHEVFFKSKIT
jgi:hypothetical protein